MVSLSTTFPRMACWASGNANALNPDTGGLAFRVEAPLASHCLQLYTSSDLVGSQFFLLYKLYKCSAASCSRALFHAVFFYEIF